MSGGLGLEDGKVWIWDMELATGNVGWEVGWDTWCVKVVTSCT